MIQGQYRQILKKRLFVQFPLSFELLDKKERILPRKHFYIILILFVA